MVSAIAHQTGSCYCCCCCCCWWWRCCRCRRRCCTHIYTHTRPLLITSQSHFCSRRIGLVTYINMPPSYQCQNCAFRHRYQKVCGSQCQQCACQHRYQKVRGGTGPMGCTSPAPRSGCGHVRSKRGDANAWVCTCGFENKVCQRHMNKFVKKFVNDTCMDCNIPKPELLEM